MADRAPERRFGPAPEPVLLFHGLGRRAASMQPLARALARAGYAPLAVGYPSTRHDVAGLVEAFVAPHVDRLLAGGAAHVHFVTHSLGGVLVRALAAERFDAGRALPAGSRAVFLAPPHAGSPVADAFHGVRAVRAVLGPALTDMTTGEAGVPGGLGPVRGIEAGVIVGTQSLVPFGRLFAGDHDGIVSVASALAPAGIADSVAVRRTHTLLMRAPEVVRLTIGFLDTGRFPGP